MNDTAVEGGTPPQVFVIDDDDLFRESLTGNLEDSDFAVTGFDGGVAALEYFKDGAPPDLILLDWKMPQVNGIDVLRQLRRDGIDTPVIFLTHLSDQIYEEAALSSGAVDFVEKSRSFPILKKRMQLILGGRRAGNSPAPQQLTHGPLVLEPSNMTAHWNGAVVALDAVEFAIVRCLVEQADNHVRARDLYAAAHSGETGDDGFRASIRNSIRRIQDKFHDVDASARTVDYDPGLGYRWRGSAG